MVYIGNNSIVIPYINMELMEDNSINQRQCYIDFSYYVFNSVGSIRFVKNNRVTNVSISNDSISRCKKEYVLISGLKEGEDCELEIMSEYFELHLMDDFKLGDVKNPFMPYDTPRYKRNLSSEMVSDFYEFENLPESLLRLIGKNALKLYWKPEI